jgi:GxxExxY protein
MELVYPEESYRIMGACFEVYRELGCGFLEEVYQEALEIEFEMQGIPFLSQVDLGLRYKNRLLKKTYRPDFICFEKILIDLKAVSDVTDGHRAQVHNYMKITGYRLGLLVNFGHHPKLEYKRIII